MTTIIEATKKPLLGQWLYKEPLAAYTTWRVGGMARALYKPADLNDLAEFLQQLPQDEPLLWLGLGSNVLIADEGFAGTVIVTQGALNNIDVALAPDTIRVEAGVACGVMARFSARLGLSGGEFWAGIPGTMGGALCMNAGCAGRETWQSVLEVETITRSGHIKKRSREEFVVHYREVEGLAQDEWFVSATCKFSLGSKEQSLAEIKRLLAQRANTQPTGEYNCGSVFRNPPNDYAARLIESCGLKGYRIGGAQVSTKHANFIINENGMAKACDIRELINKIRAEVLDKTGVNLVREVHFVGKDYD